MSWRIRICVVLLSLFWVESGFAQAWVWLPSVALDQRFDDNYRLRTEDSESVSATRLVGNLGLNRESQISSVRALLRADALLSVGQESKDELDSNQFAFIDTSFTHPRALTEISLNLKRDTPNRDISTDITDVTAVPADAGASTTQDENVDRTRLVLNPRYSYNLSRLTTLLSDYSYTQVKHGKRSCDDALALFLEAQPDDAEPQSNPVFKTADELDDFEEHAVKLTLRSRLSVLSSYSISAGYSLFEAEEESDEGDAAESEDCKALGFVVKRDPKRKTTVNTARFTVGYDTQLSPTLSIGGQLGYYVTDSSKLKPIVDEDFDGQPDGPVPQYEDSSSSGYLFNLSLTKRASITTYTGKVSIEVYPSDVGDVVESLNLEGDYTRKVTERLDFNLKLRAFEPDTISDDNDDDKFARRFISMEPKVVWRFTRDWTVGASYRYRRQKSQAETKSSESNALLFSVKYVPPSALRDLAKSK